MICAHHSYYWEIPTVMFLITTYVLPDLQIRAGLGLSHPRYHANCRKTGRVLLYQSLMANGPCPSPISQEPRAASVNTKYRCHGLFIVLGKSLAVSLPPAARMDVLVILSFRAPGKCISTIANMGAKNPAVSRYLGHLKSLCIPCGSEADYYVLNCDIFES